VAQNRRVLRRFSLSGWRSRVFRGLDASTRVFDGLWKIAIDVGKGDANRGRWIDTRSPDDRTTEEKRRRVEDARAGVDAKGRGWRVGS
jgi:hypothetical protein